MNVNRETSIQGGQAGVSSNMAAANLSQVTQVIGDFDTKTKLSAIPVNPRLMRMVPANLGKVIDNFDKTN